MCEIFDVEVDKIKVDIALKMYEQAYTNIRHWDQIRWLVPAWFVALAIAVFGMLFLPSIKEHMLFAGFIFFGLSAFAAACIYLMERLIEYHNKQVDSFINIAKLMPVDFKEALLCDLPFSLKMPELKNTATYLFMRLIKFIGFLSFIISIILLVNCIISNPYVFEMFNKMGLSFLFWQRSC